MDVRIDRLRIAFDGARGHEHRVAPVAHRAAEALQELLAERPLPERGHVQVERLEAPRVELDLALAGDEEAARRIAESVYAALALRLAAPRARRAP